MMDTFILCTVGLAGGFAVGGGFVAFLTVLDIIPRLIQLTKTKQYLVHYEFAVILGANVSTWISFWDPAFSLPSIILVIIGLASGTFIGLLAAALTEVLNVFPIIVKRIGMYGKLQLFIWALVFGKIIGSLFQWLYFVHL